jgi:hypothetical protein
LQEGQVVTVCICPRKVFCTLLTWPLPPQGELPGNFGCKSSTAFPGVACDFPLPANLVTTEKYLVVPYTQSVSLTIERQIGGDFALSVGYAGKLSQKLEGHRHWNPAVFKNDPITGQAPSAQNINNRVLFPQTIGLFNTQSRVLGNDYRSGYHSAQFRIEKRFSRGFSFMGSYVLGKGVDNVNAPQPGLTPGVGNPFNPFFTFNNVPSNGQTSVTTTAGGTVNLVVSQTLANQGRTVGVDNYTCTLVQR